VIVPSTRHTRPRTTSMASSGRHRFLQNSVDDRDQCRDDSRHRGLGDIPQITQELLWRSVGDICMRSLPRDIVRTISVGRPSYSTGSGSLS
jgi:hypothetical protein